MRHLQGLHAGLHLAAREQAWPSPDILPWSNWLARLWNERKLDERAAGWQQLSDAQAQWLWRDIIEQDSGGSLYHVPALAQTAWEAWSLMREWRLSPMDLAGFADEDSRAFARWAQQYEQRCRQRQWQDSASLPLLLVEAIQGHHLSLPQRVWLAGFDELTPLQSHLLDCLRQADVSVKPLESPQLSGTIVRTSLATPEAEAWAVAHWLRAQLLARPGQRLALVVPDLQQRRQRLLRVLDQVLSPNSLLPGNREQPRPYNVSLGEPLSTVPMVADALRILSLGRERLPFAEVAALLRSPYLKGAAEEAEARACLDAVLRQQEAATVGAGALKYHSAAVMPQDGQAMMEPQRARHACPMLHASLLRWFAQRDAMRKRQSPSKWAQQFAGLLGAMGWPGDRSLSSVEYQQQEGWRDLLDQFAAMECVAPDLNYGEALALLRQQADQKLFQAESPDAPVQVLGVLETTGQSFDAMWVMGLHDELWPPAPRPNPLLPVHLQRQQGMPHASAERELAFIETVTRRLLASSTTIILSSPLREDDRERRPSPLIKDIAPTPIEAVLAPGADDWLRTLHDASHLEVLAPDAAPPFTASQAAGGAALFRDQSACPFRAFAVHRLGARPLDEPDVGLDAAGRGELVHLALEHFWKQVRDHATLLALSASELDEAMDVAAGVAVSYGHEHWPDTFTERFMKLEQQRLLRLLNSWLQQEKPRAPFAVEYLELKSRAQVGGLSVTTRIDRVDRLLHDDRLVVIDYKTGASNSARKWLGERPEEPQLPLYSQFDERLQTQSLSAVSVGCVRTGECGFTGLAREENLLPGIKSFRHTDYDWDGLQQAWKRVLEQLAHSFTTGDAAVDPRDGNACRYCHLMSLCRVHELERRQEADDEQD